MKQCSHKHVVAVIATALSLISGCLSPGGGVGSNLSSTVPGDGCAPEDSSCQQLTSCNYSVGTGVSTTLSSYSSQIDELRNKIEHIVVIMMENRSVDHLYGALTIPGQIFDGIPPGWTSDTSYSPILVTNNVCIDDVPHAWSAIHQGWNDGRMDSFVAASTASSMYYYDDNAHPFYTWLMRNFASGDRYFCSALSSTWPNREFLLMGKSYWQDTGSRAEPLAYEDTIFRQLDVAGRTWKVYLEDHPDSRNALEGVMDGTTGTAWTLSSPLRPPGLQPYSQFFKDIDERQLPDVVMLDSEARDEHPGDPTRGDLHQSEAFVREAVTKIINSPYWNNTVIVITYDEGGGRFDHVPPPRACLADDDPRSTQWLYDRLGIRVPLIVVSRYATQGVVSHLTHSHTSVLRLIQARYNLPALTRRDANSDALLDMFDFNSSRDPPTNVPDVGTSPPGCNSSLWGHQTPSIGRDASAANFTVGTKFRPLFSDRAVGVLYYANRIADAGPHRGKLWEWNPSDDSCTLIASVDFTGDEKPGMWNIAWFGAAQMVQLDPARWYIVSRNTNNDERGVAYDDYFVQELNTGVLMAPAQSIPGGNGVWAAGDTCPTNSGQASYFVDVLVDGVH